MAEALSDEEITALLRERDFRIQEAHGKGRIVMEQCRLCGWLQFQCQHTAEPDKVEIVAMMSQSNCPRCTEVRGRAPEVFAWVTGVANMIVEREYTKRVKAT